MAARSRSVGRYDLVVEVAKSQLGPLWAATERGTAGLELRWVRRVAVGAGTSARELEVLADLGRWSSGVRAEQVPSTLDVVSEERDLTLVTRYFPGESLRSLLKLTSLKRESVPPRLALALALDVCKAVAAAETRALETGRDPEFLWGGLLPDSIWLGTDGTTRVLDLGVASMWRGLASEAQHPEVTAYSAPERTESGPAAASADVFTLGIVLWELLSGGRRLFAASSQRAVVEKLQKLTAPPELPADVDDATRTLLRALLEPDPQARMSDLRELQRTLENGPALAAPRELADFLARIAGTTLASRERALQRVLQQATGRRPTSEPPPRPTLPPGAARPLPLPAQAKLAARGAGFDSRLPPPPPAPERLLDIDARGNEEEETGSVRAEDILAALAVDDLESGPAAAPSAPAPEPEVKLEAEPEATEPSAPAPLSSRRRAPLTAVVVPSIVAGSDATFTPVPSVLQTLRGPGVPPLGSEALGLPTSGAPTTAPATPVNPVPAGLAPASSRSTKLAKAVDAARAVRRRLPTSVIAAVGGATLLLVIALVAAAGGDAEPAPEAASQELASERADVARQSATEQPPPAAPKTPAPEPAKATDVAPEAVAADEPRAETDPDDATSQAVAQTQEASALAVAAVVTTPRATAPKVVRRTSAAGRANTPTTKKKKLKATRKYIPSGI